MIQPRSRSELYTDFIQFVLKEVQEKRQTVSRRMLSVFLWCFFLPAMISIIVLVLVKTGLLPRWTRNHLDWVILLFPSSYALYVFGSEGIQEVVRGFRKGGSITALESSRNEGLWRDGICHGMVRALGNSSREDWTWIHRSFRMDLQQIVYRNRTLTVLAGAVFFLILQGLDLIDPQVTINLPVTPLTFMQLIEASLDKVSQFVALGIFLILVYLTGAESQQVLEKYLNCSELISLDPEKYVK